MIESTEIAINIRNISKSYRLYKKKSERILELLNPFKKKYHTTFLALDSINLSIQKGEIVGIIGQNGSGKSTLFKILASVVTPTSGSIERHGKVTALLEMGGGFNSELTGRENIYFIGAIQGYSRKQMDERVQRIIDFADIGTYIDQPVKNYSSGMHVRLAFSMTTNIDPEILITDEAITVGDLRFQQKCYRHIRTLKDQGKTIILCTHGLGTVREFCTRAIWLHKGKVIEDGDPITVTQNYTAFMASQGNQQKLVEHKSSIVKTETKYINEQKKYNWLNLEKCEGYGIGGAQIKHVVLFDTATNTYPVYLKGGENLRILLNIVVNAEIKRPALHVYMNAQFGNPILKLTSNSYEQKINLKTGENNIVAVDFTFPNLGNGKYTLSFGLLEPVQSSPQYIHWVHDGIILEVKNDDLKYKIGALVVLPSIRVQNIEL